MCIVESLCILNNFAKKGVLLLGLSLLYICSANPIVLEFHWQSARARCPRFPPSTDPDKLLPSQISGLPAFLGYFCDRAQTSALSLPRPATSKPSPLTRFGVVSRCGIHNEHWATLDCVAFISILKQKNIHFYIFCSYSYAVKVDFILVF